MIIIHREMNYFWLHHSLTTFWNFSWEKSLLINFYAIILSIWVWAVRYFTFSINIIIVKLKHCSSIDRCVSSSNSKSLYIINHCHIWKDDSICHVIAVSAHFETLVCYKRWSLITCIYLICCCVSKKLYSHSS